MGNVDFQGVRQEMMIFVQIMELMTLSKVIKIWEVAWDLMCEWFNRKPYMALDIKIRINTISSHVPWLIVHGNKYIVQYFFANGDRLHPQ